MFHVYICVCVCKHVTHSSGNNSNEYMFVCLCLFMCIYTPPERHKRQHAQLLMYRPSHSWPFQLCKTNVACRRIICRVDFRPTGPEDVEVQESFLHFTSLVNRYVDFPSVHYDTCSVIVTKTSLVIVAGTRVPKGLVAITYSESCP